MGPSSADLGSVQIRHEVIGSIAVLAAQEVEGVMGVWLGTPVLRCFKKWSGVRVETGDLEVRLWLSIVVEYGMNLPQVAAFVQEKVRERVEQMTHLTASEVHVNVHQVKLKRS